MKSYICNILLLVVLSMLTACSSDYKPEQQVIDLPTSENFQVSDSVQTVISLADTTHVYTPAGFYDSWETARYENIKIIYPADHMFADKMSEYALLYKTVLRRNSQFFKLSEPTNEIVMFYYTGFGQGQDLGNSEFPTVRGDTIYYWSGNRFGITAAMHALNRWTKIKSKHDLLNHGLMRLLDASGRNYHEMTLAFIDSSNFKSLDSLVVDERINFLSEAKQTAEVASFIDYFVFRYGIDNFRLLYESQIRFDSTIQIICKKDLDALEKDWILVVGQAMKKK